MSFPGIVAQIQYQAAACCAEDQLDDFAVERFLIVQHTAVHSASSPSQSSGGCFAMHLACPIGCCLPCSEPQISARNGTCTCKCKRRIPSRLQLMSSSEHLSVALRIRHIRRARPPACCSSAITAKSMAELAVGIVSLAGLFDNAVESYGHVRLGQHYARDFETY